MTSTDRREAVLNRVNSKIYDLVTNYLEEIDPNLCMGIDTKLHHVRVWRDVAHTSNDDWVAIFDSIDKELEKHGYMSDLLPFKVETLLDNDNLLIQVR